MIKFVKNNSLCIKFWIAELIYHVFHLFLISNSFFDNINDIYFQFLIYNAIFLYAIYRLSYSTVSFSKITLLHFSIISLHSSSLPSTIQKILDLECWNITMEYGILILFYIFIIFSLFYLYSVILIIIMLSNFK